MTDGAVLRTEYWNIASRHRAHRAHRARREPHRHGELSAAPGPGPRRRAVFLGSGRRTGRARVGRGAGRDVAPGTALDGVGRLHRAGRRRHGDHRPTMDPAQVQGVPTVPVGASGVTLPTANAGTDSLLTLTWREVGAEQRLGNAPALLHAPWLRLDTGGRVRRRRARRSCWRRSRWTAAATSRACRLAPAPGGGTGGPCSNCASPGCSRDRAGRGPAGRGDRPRPS